MRVEGRRFESCPQREKGAWVSGDTGGLRSRTAGKQRRFESCRSHIKRGRKLVADQGPPEPRMGVRFPPAPPTVA